MKRERLGFKFDEGLIVKSPETGIAAKVELQKDGTAVASLMKWTEEMEMELEMQAKEEEEIPSKKKIIAGMLLFYLGLTGLFICFSGVVVGIMSGVFFTATTAFELWCLLPQVINAFKHKEEAQYAYIYRKLYACYNAGQEINKENIKNISVNPTYEFGNRINIINIRKITLGIILTGVILMTRYVNMIIMILIDVGILIIYVCSAKNEKLLEKLTKINELLVYRKPTEEQIDIVLFGFRYLKKCEETSDLMKWFYWH